MKTKLITGTIALLLAGNTAGVTVEAKSLSSIQPESLLVKGLDIDPIGVHNRHWKEWISSLGSPIELEKQYQIHIDKIYQEKIAKTKEEEEIKQKEIEKKEEEKRLSSITFDSMDVTKVSNLTTNELISILQNVNGGQGLIPYAHYFIEAEKTYGINALFICSLAAQESGWGKHAAGNGTNLTGYQVYNAQSDGKTFEGGVRENILATTELIAKDYVDPKGDHHTVIDGYNNGKSIYEINTKYCLLQDMKTTDYRWSKSISSIGTMLLTTFNSLNR